MRWGSVIVGPDKETGWGERSDSEAAKDRNSSDTKINSPLKYLSGLLEPQR